MSIFLLRRLGKRSDLSYKQISRSGKYKDLSYSLIA